MEWSDISMLTSTEKYLLNQPMSIDANEPSSCQRHCHCHPTKSNATARQPCLSPLLGDLTRCHEPEQHLNGNQRVLVDELGQLVRGKTDVEDQLGILF